MARWNTLEDDALDARTIYVGAYGFPDCDAFGRVWAHTLKGFDSAIRNAINATGRMYENEHESARALAAEMWYVGPFAQTVGETLTDLEERDRAEEMRDDIRTSSHGYVY